MDTQKTIWFDVSEIKGWQGHFTGIQRVAFNLGRELAKDPSLSLRFCRYDRRRRIFTETDYEFIEPQYNDTSVDKDDARVTVTTHKLKKVVGRFLPLRVKRFIKSIASFNSRPFISLQKSIRFTDQDTVFIPGAFWTGSLNPMLAIKAKKKPRVVAVMFDMVPIVTPQFCTEGTVIDFKREIGNAASVVDTWLAISENTKKDLLDYARDNNLSIKAEKVLAIRLGSNINTKGLAKSPFKAEFEPKEFLLFVSTIEARKNQQLVYQAVKRAQELGIQLPPIVLAGKHGWHSDDLISVLRRDKTLAGKLIWLAETDDRALRWLYKKCLFTVYPSLYEGWGLPVSESLAYQKFSIASNTSSIPEVAGDIIDYFSPYSVDDFLQKVNEYLVDRKKLTERTKRLIQFSQPTWTDTANQVRVLLGI